MTVTTPNSHGRTKVLSDRKFLVHVNGWSRSFKTTLDSLEIEWDPIQSCYPWIEFEATAHELRTIIEAFPNIEIDILE